MQSFCWVSNSNSAAYQPCDLGIVCFSVPSLLICNMKTKALSLEVGLYAQNLKVDHKGRVGLGLRSSALCPSELAQTVEPCREKWLGT